MNAVPATRGPIEAVADSKSGKTLSVRVGGKYFSTKQWEFRSMIGQVIEFVPDVSEWQGNTITWINDYTTPNLTAADAMDQAMAAGPGNTIAQPVQHRDPAPAAQPAPTASPIHATTYLPMTSNLVAHAIAAGLITEPNQIAPWAKAAFSTAKNLLEPSTANISGSSATEFDDDIPF